MTSGLRVDGLTVRFGGNVAVEDVTFDAPAASVTGLIGPNGAGKTTIFNACSGLVRPAAGEVSLFGHRLTRLSVSHRGRAGLGRTFQRMELFESMSVRENVLVGVEARHAGRNPLHHLVQRARESDATASAVDEALGTCGLTGLTDANVSRLSTGQRRLVDLARVLGSGCRFLLLDEPSSGLDDAETANFARILRSAVERAELGVLLVEHDIALISSVCANVHVLDFGRLIFSGAPDEVRASDLVQAAYLGAEA